MKITQDGVGSVLCWVTLPGNRNLPLTYEEADVLWRELERRCTDEKVRRAEAARKESP